MADRDGGGDLFPTHAGDVASARTEGGQPEGRGADLAAACPQELPQLLQARSFSVTFAATGGWRT